MGTLWTPGGERRVGSEPPAAGADATAAPRRPAPTDTDDLDDLTPEEVDARVAALRAELAKTPAAAVVANHCLGLFELAALHLSQQPPQLEEAQLAIDALGHVVEGLEGRLGDDEDQLKEGLAQLRLAFVQIRVASGDAGAEP